MDSQYQARLRSPKKQTAPLRRNSSSNEPTSPVRRRLDLDRDATNSSSSATDLFGADAVRDVLAPFPSSPSKQYSDRCERLCGLPLSCV